MMTRMIPQENRAIFVVALGFWTAAATVGALRVILPVHFASIGMAVAEIGVLFAWMKVAELIAPLGAGVVVNRFGSRRTFIGSLGLHSLMSFLYLVTPAVTVYLERFVRGLLSMQLQSAVYVKHFSRKEDQRFHINMMLGLRDAAKGIGMLLGGVLLVILPFDYAVAVFGLVTAVAMGVALRALPEFKEETQLPIRKIWSSVEGRIKTIGLARGLLHGAWDAWGIVILPVILITVYGLSPAWVGAVIAGEHIFHGLCATFLSKYVGVTWDPRRALVIGGLLLMVVCLVMAGSLPLYLFVLMVLLYQALNSLCVVYYHQLKIGFASGKKASLDLAAYTTLSSAMKPVAVFLSGILANAMGFAWAFYLAALFVLLSVLTCLAIPKPAASPASEQVPLTEVPLADRRS